MILPLASAASSQVSPLWLCIPFALLLLLIAVMPGGPH
jgi:hypothetical protein